jgi:hypothetical protein
MPANSNAFRTDIKVETLLAGTPSNCSKFLIVRNDNPDCWLKCSADQRRAARADLI